MATRIHVSGNYRYEEYKANTTGITPGHMIELNSSGKVIVHATQGGHGEAMFAMEDVLQGETVTNTYDVANDIVACILPAKGSVINALIKAGEDIAIGDKLISAGDGTLIEAGTAGSGSGLHIVAEALEACDLTATGAVKTLAKVRIV